MEKPIDSFAEHVIGDILGHIPNITKKRMFGGYGLYLEGHIFAIITSDSDLYFKVDDSNRADYEAIGSAPFIYTGHKTKKPTTMPYWIVPEEIFDDRDTLRDMVEESAAITARAKR